MVHCDSCGNEAQEGLILCPQCGHKLKYNKTSQPLPEKKIKNEKNEKKNDGGFPEVHAVPKSDPIKQSKPIAQTDQKKPTPKELIQQVQKKAQGATTSTSPYAKKNKSPKLLLILIISVIFAVVAIALILSMENTPCQASWVCGSWQGCINNTEIRACIDQNECGTEAGKPIIEQSCVSDIPLVNLTINQTNTSQTNTSNDTIENISTCPEFGDYCELDECCENLTCLHHLCVDTVPYCNDGYCDEGENCSSCAYDCGECPTTRELEVNVFTEPLEYQPNLQFKEGGYVIVHYFYSDSCSPCFYPIHIENALRDMAAQLKDIMVLELINTFKYGAYAQREGQITGRVYTPSIILEGTAGGVSGIEYLYSSSLGDIIADGDVAGAIAPLICEHSDYCDWDGSKVMKTYDVEFLVNNTSTNQTLDIS